MPRKKKSPPKVESVRLDSLRPNRGSRKPRRRIGRGPGSGSGKTAGAGHKGQLARTGFSRQRGFEGGQMPLHRRIPKRGFRNIFRKEYVVVNLDQIAQFQGEVTPSNLLTTKVIKSIGDGVVILGRGEAPKGLRVVAHRISRTARQKIEAAGGSVKVVDTSRKPVKRKRKISGTVSK